MPKPNQPPFLETARAVEQGGRELFARYFGARFPSAVDYISVYPETTEAYNAQREEASLFGEQIDEKNGEVYRIYTPRAWQIARIIRVREPLEANISKIGCVDFCVEDYEQLRSAVIGLEGFTEHDKERNGVPYKITQLVVPESSVDVYVPSIPMTSLMLAP